MKTLKKSLLVLLLVVLTLSLVACGAKNKEFIFATDLVDNLTVYSADYSFNASATYGDEFCDIDVKVNDISVAVNSNNCYDATLNEGNNTIVVTATHGDNIKTKTYNIIFSSDFTIESDILNAEAQGNILNFTVTTKHNNVSCDNEVTVNGTKVLISDGVYTAYLKNGQNIIKVYAISGNLKEEKTYTINFSSNFDIQTNIDDVNIIDGAITFTATATHNESPCNLTVKVNDIDIIASNNTYTSNIKKGQNTIQLIATAGELTEKKVYNINCDFKIDTNIESATIVNGKIEFLASAKLNNNNLDVIVKINDNIVEKVNDKYAYTLLNGNNTIVITSQSGNLKEEKTININAQHNITSDFSSSKVLNDKVSFDVNAVLQNNSVVPVVEFNGKQINKDTNTNKYVLTLSKGDNTIVVTARKGDMIVTYNFTKNYVGFSIISDIVEGVRFDSLVKFRLNTVYGEDYCDNTVQVNGQTITPVSGNKYEYNCTVQGEYNFVVTATANDGNKKVQKFVVQYISDPPVFSLLTLQDGKKLKGKTLTFDVIANDPLGNKIPDSALSFYLDSDGEDGVESYTKLSLPEGYNKGDLTLVWSDNVKTSFCIDLQAGKFKSLKGKPFVIKVVATLGTKEVEKKFNLTYVGADPDGKIGEITFSLEAFSLGIGYIIKPVNVPIYETTNDKIQNGATILTSILTENGLTYENTGSVESSFYLSHIKGLNMQNNKIEQNMQDFLNMRGIGFVESIAPDDNGTYSLGEFCYTSGSGWMYSVNGTFPNYGFSNYFPQDGDVVRVQFTLCLGSDIGGGQSVGSDIEDGVLTTSYFEIHQMLAKIATPEYAHLDKNVYNEVIKVISKWNVSQDIINQQLQKLKSFYGA